MDRLWIILVISFVQKADYCFRSTKWVPFEKAYTRTPTYMSEGKSSNPLVITFMKNHLYRNI